MTTLKLFIDYILDFFVSFLKGSGWCGCPCCGFNAPLELSLVLISNCAHHPFTSLSSSSSPSFSSLSLFRSLSHPPSSPCTALISYKRGGVRDWQAMRGESRQREKQRHHLKSHRPFLMTSLQRGRITVYQKKQKQKKKTYGTAKLIILSTLQKVFEFMTPFEFCF